MFGVVMNLVCITCAAVRSEQWVPRGWGTYASLDFHRTRKERSCTLANAGICSRKQLSCLSCQREAQPGNFTLPMQGCWSSSSHIPSAGDTSVQSQRAASGTASVPSSWSWLWQPLKSSAWILTVPLHQSILNSSKIALVSCKGRTASAFHLLSNGFLNGVAGLGLLQTVPCRYNKPDWCVSTMAYSELKCKTSMNFFQYFPGIKFRSHESQTDQEIL